MRQGPQGPPPLWLIALVVVGLVVAAVTIGDVRSMSVLLAAILGAFATLVFTEWRQARQRVTALIGYATLLDTEIEANESVVDALSVKHRDRYLMDLHKYGGYIPPSIEFWPEISVKLAPLIAAEEFASINAYYRQLRVLLDLKEGRALGSARGQPVAEFVRKLKILAKEARRLLSGYADPPLRVRWLGFWR